MTFLQSIILGLVQGFTEFLPISSSAHLILIRNVLSLPIEGSLSFDVYLHLATLLAIIYCFKGDIWRIFKDLQTEGLSSRSKNLLWAIVLGSIPASGLGFFFQREIESVFRNDVMIAAALIFGSIMMFVADRMPKDYEDGGVKPAKGLIVGVFQAFALIPGVSRSGASISGGIFSGISREESVKFAFLLAIPTIAGAALKTFLDAGADLASYFDLSHVLGFVSALASGIWSIKFLIRYLNKNSFNIFIYYRLLLAGLIFLFVFLF